MKVLLPQGQRGGPNRGNKGISFKDYSTIMVQQNVTKIDVKHPWERVEGDGLLPGA